MKARYQRSKLISFLLISCLSIGVNAQRVGIGTISPLRKLAVTGSILVDQNSNNIGTLDSAALVFGNAGHAGISSRQNGLESNSLTFWTNNVPYMNLSNQGNLGIGGGSGPLYRLWVRNGNTRLEGHLYIDENIFTQGHISNEGTVGIGGIWDPLYRLRVYNGNTRLGGDLHATGNVAFGGDVDPDYRLRVWAGNTRFGGDMHATGNVGVGGVADNNFKLKVYNGSSLLDGSLQVTGHAIMTSIGSTGNISTNATISAGTVNVNNTLTIDGKGSVRSAGPSPLRVGFYSKTVDIPLAAGGMTTVTADIIDFSGGEDDVRVFVSQLEQNAGNTMAFANLIVQVSNVSAANDNCMISLKNTSALPATLKATIYLTAIARN